MSNLNKNQMVNSIEEVIDSIKTNPNTIVFIPDTPNISEKEIMEDEYQLLGYFVTKHPLDDYKVKLNSLDKISELENKRPGDQIHLGGIISKLSVKKTKAGGEMAFLTLEDITGRIEVIVFTKLFSSIKEHLKQNALIELIGKLEIEEKEINEEIIYVPKAIGIKIFPLESQKVIKEIHLRITKNDNLEKIKSVISNRYGHVKVFIDYENFLLETSYQIPQTMDLINEIRNLCLIKEVE